MSAGVIRLGRSGRSQPVVAAAIHDASFVRPEVEERMALSAAERNREEDPHTGEWALAAPTSLVALRSRFEFDLNRPRESAVYLRPEDAWGLDVWREAPGPELIEASLACYDRFYRVARAELETLVLRHGRLVVLDLHTYNHRRNGPAAPPAPAADNPEVNVGTGSLDRARWGPVVDAAIAHLRSCGFDTRENVKFRGGNFPGWIHQEFPTSGCCLALEFKKTFMDEWTGEVDPARSAAIRDAIDSLVDDLGSRLLNV
ncbi:MAG: N-formylglutamate amidohydrolase [Planctomycetota bacterium]|jgi:N-formylglutamate amidohydrolase